MESNKIEKDLSVMPVEIRNEISKTVDDMFDIIHNSEAYKMENNYYEKKTLDSITQDSFSNR